MTNLTDAEEQEAKCLIVSPRFGCPYRRILQRLGWEIDSKCPNEEKAIREIKKYFADKENEKYEREYPDG